MRKLLLSSFSLLLLSACGDTLPDWIGEEDKAKLPGERVSVLAHKSTVTADPEQEKLTIKLPDAKANAAWVSQHVQPGAHLSAPDRFSGARSLSLGSAPEEGIRLTSAPLAAEETLYALDGNGVITARSLSDPEQELWQRKLDTGVTRPDIMGLGFDLSGEEEKSFLGGNITYADGMILAATAHGKVHALDAKTGEQRWMRDVKIPLRAAPVYDDGLVFVVTTQNRLYALEGDTGVTRWTHEGLEEVTSIYGAPSPVIEQELIIVPYSSGELYALEKDIGRPRWQDLLLNRSARSTSKVAVNDIDAAPVVHDGSVYAVSHDGVLTAYNLATGSKRWSQDISSVQTPWAAGNFLFVVTTNDELVALHTLDGKIKWVSQLPTHGDVSLSWGGDNKGDPLDWQGPALAGNHLLVTSTHGQLLQINPYNGSVVATQPVGANTFLPPIVVGGAVYSFSNDATLTILR